MSVSLKMILERGMAENVLQKICRSNSKVLMWTALSFLLKSNGEDGAKILRFDRILDIRRGGEPQGRRSGNPVYLPDSRQG